MTTFADQVLQFGGVPVGISPVSAYGKHWFVDGNQGAGGNGKSPRRAFTTMDAAFDVAGSGDVIYFRGNVTEQLVTPTGVFDVSVVGCGNRPRHADAHTGNNGYSGATWKAPSSGGTAAQATVRVLQQGWQFLNILFSAIDANAAMVEIVRDAGAGDAERDASHAVVRGCRLAGAGVGVRLTATSFTENPFNVLIQGNTFNGCTTGILAAAAQPNMVQILDNYFPSNTSAITAKLQASIIARNIINIFTASGNAGGIDLRSGGGNNLVTGNSLGGAYTKAGGYNCEAGDQWWGNYADVTGGVTQADPA